MSNQEVKVRISTSADTRGAKEATRSLADMERELQDVKKAFAAAANGSKEFTAARDKIASLSNEISQAAKATKSLGRGGNAGGAVLEFSRAFEDAQYGIRGVLNNIPSLVTMLGGGMGLAGVISLAAVAGTQLWERLSNGAKESKNPLKDYNDQFKGMVENFEAMEEAADKAREKAREGSEDILKGNLAGIADETRRASASDSLESARERAQTMLELAESRIRLASLERQITTAGGEDSIRLARSREEVVLSILESEIQISNMKRREAIEGAETKAVEAFNQSGAKSENLSTVASQYESLIERQKALRDEGRKYTEERIAAIKAEQAAIEARNTALEAAGRNQSLAGEAYDAIALETRAKNAGSEAKASKLLIPGQEESKLYAEANMLTGKIEELAPELKAATEAQTEAAQQLQIATEALSNLREMQSVEQGSELGLKATEIGQGITKSIVDAIAALKATPASGNPAATTEAISRLESIANDETPDGKQGGQVASILQSLANQFTAKDARLAGGIQTLIDAVKAQDAVVKVLTQQIDDLKSRMTVSPGS